MRPKENKEIVCQVYDGSICPISKNPDVPESSEAGQDLWVFCR